MDCKQFRNIILESFLSQSRSLREQSQCSLLNSENRLVPTIIATQIVSYFQNLVMNKGIKYETEIL
jgi:hypothetical protein